MSTLTATPRSVSTPGQVHDLRKKGFIPAIIYGLKKEPQAIQVEEGLIHKFLAAGNLNQIIELDVDGKIERVLLKEFTRNPVKDHKILHVDFLRVDDSHPVVVKVPVKTTGIPIGVKTEGGQFSVLKKFVRIKCVARDIPDVFESDITELHSGSMVYVRDLIFEKGTILTPAKTALYGISTKKLKEEVVEKPVEAEKKGEETSEEAK